MISREQLAEENEMSIDFVNWFFNNKKDGCGNAWFMMMAAMWEGWKCNEQKLTDMAVQLANAESKCRELAAENANKHEFIATCFRAAADGGSMDGADIQEIGERLGLFGRETYQPILHGYICGHEAGDDTVYVMKKNPATDAFQAEVRASAVEEFVRMADYSESVVDGDVIVTSSSVFNAGHEFAAQLRKGGDA